MRRLSRRTAGLAAWFIVYVASLLNSCTAALRSEDPNLVAPTEPRTPQEQLKLFHLPPGFEIQLVAAEPDIRKPMNIAFDDRSRLWVTTSVEYPYAAKEGASPRDAIKILEDADGDGRAEIVKTFVDGLNIPIGVLPVRDGCIAYSIPHIWRFRDTDGDDRADTCEVLYSSFGFGDTHGMASSFTWGFDGWIYATHGFSNTSEVKGADGSLVKMQSGNTFRFRPDGSHVEQYTWGQVNPFGLCFDPLGNLYSADCHSRPITMLLRGAYYPSFGKPHDGLGFAPEICTHEHGSTGIAGIVYYAADHFPAEYRDTIFTGNPVTNRINHDRLERHGSTLMAVHQPDFLTCDDRWFRPVAMTLGPDGALYVADFYNKIIGHYEVPLTHPGRDRERGRIWQIIYTGPDGMDRPKPPRRDWTTASFDELIDDIGHPNLVVRTKATNQLVDRIGQKEKGRLNQLAIQGSSAWQRAHAYWATKRLGSWAMVNDPDPLVRSHQMKLWGEENELPTIARRVPVFGLRDSDAFVRRAAVESMGRHPSVEYIAPLLGLRSNVSADDTHLLHAVRMALRDQLRENDIIKSVAVRDLNDMDARNLADAANGVATAAAAEALVRYLQTHASDQADAKRFIGHIARHIAGDRVPEVFDLGRRLAGEDLRGAAALVQTMNEGLQARGAAVPEELRDWAIELSGKLVATGQPDEAGDGIALARTMKLQPMIEPLRQIAAGKMPPDSRRDDAITALVAIAPAQQVPLLSEILGDPTQPMPLRQHVAASLGQIQAVEAQEELVRHLRTAPESLSVPLAAGLAGRRAGAEKLLAEVAAGKASARLLQNPVVNGRLRASGLPELESKLAQLTEGLPPAEARLQEAIQQRRAGYAKAQANAGRGAKVFEKHCANCHTIAGRGAKVGPQLDGIGVRGLDRILEDVLDPNRNVDQAFRSSAIALKNGQVLTGLVLANDGEVVVLADALGKEVRVLKGDIEERTVSKLSPMPANVAEIVPEPDFYDLVAYLIAQRDGSSPSGK